ncbi:MAG: hypothetical protein ACLTL6_13760 [Holdemanella porci]
MWQRRERSTLSKMQGRALPEASSFPNVVNIIEEDILDGMNKIEVFNITI